MNATMVASEVRAVPPVVSCSQRSRIFRWSGRFCLRLKVEFYANVRYFTGLSEATLHFASARSAMM